MPSKNFTFSCVTCNCGSVGVFLVPRYPDTLAGAHGGRFDVPRYGHVIYFQSIYHPTSETSGPPPSSGVVPPCQARPPHRAALRNHGHKRSFFLSHLWMIMPFSYLKITFFSVDVTRTKIFSINKKICYFKRCNPKRQRRDIYWL